ncbi:uncharacterized protein LOC135173017 [Diachasmimorpha longicaudata]|uniref:uncharacterized protein LOC135173017 n=1 Tax=Diachasmimorpha longicaudata TaxID=58733 RepID=UPI0030B8BFFD
MVHQPSKLSQQTPTHDKKARINHELQYTHWLLTVLGIWPLISNNMTRLAKVSSLVLIAINIFAVAFVLIPLVMFMATRVKTLRGRFTFTGPVSFRISNFLKLVMMAHRADSIKECIDQIKNDWVEVVIKNEQEAMLKSVELGRKLTMICAAFMFSSGTFFHVGMPLLRPRKVNAFNVTIRPHLYPGYDVFVDSQATPAYEIIFAAHCFCAASGYTIVTAACNLAAVFVSHISGQVEVIRLKLERLHGSGDNKGIDFNEQIASIVRSHVKILRFSEHVKTTLREICLVEILFSTVVICWLEFYCMTEWHNSEAISIVTYFLLLVSLTFNIFIYCYIGQILKDQCESVGLMTYLIDWHRIPSKNILSLAFTISMARCPKTITAGGLMHLTIQSFGDVSNENIVGLSEHDTSSHSIKCMTVKGMKEMLLHLYFHSQFPSAVNPSLIKEKNYQNQRFMTVMRCHTQALRHHEIGIKRCSNVIKNGYNWRKKSSVFVESSVLSDGHRSLVILLSLHVERSSFQIRKFSWESTSEFSMNISKSKVDSKTLRKTNRYYHSDIQRTFRMTKWLLTPLGVWLLISKNPTRIHIYTSITLIGTWMLVILWVILPSTRYLAFVEKDRNVRVTKIGPVSYVYKTVILYSVIILTANRIKKCIEHVKSDWRQLAREDDRQIMIKNLDFSRKITIICGIFMYSGGLSYHSIMQVWSGNKINDLNKTIRPLVYPGNDDFLDSQATPAYELIFTGQFIMAFICCTITTSSCNITATLVGHTLGQIQILRMRIKKIIDEDDTCHCDSQQRIGAVIRAHVSVLRLTAEIEKVLRNMCLVEVFGSTFVMCAVEYYIIKEWSNSDSIVFLTYVALFFSLSFNIFLFCQIGEIMTEKCDSIGQLVYGIPWYNLPSKLSLPLTRIIAISHCPRKLSAGGLLTLSMMSFAAVNKHIAIDIRLSLTL